VNYNRFLFMAGSYFICHETVTILITWIVHVFLPNGKVCKSDLMLKMQAAFEAFFNQDIS